MKALILTAFIVISCILQISCKKDDDNNPPSITVTDIDGNLYHAVTIGTQVWMVENLKVTRYRNGDLIGTTTPASLYVGDGRPPKYQWAYDSNDGNVAAYGRLYTWYAIKDSRKVCPVDWHVPSNAEWTELTDYLGGEDVAGGKLKEIGLTHWNSPNEGATNESGFTALPGGYRDNYGEILNIGGLGYWWSSTEYDAYSAWDRNMFYLYANVNYHGSIKEYGFSVRCIRD